MVVEEAKSVAGVCDWWALGRVGGWVALLVLEVVYELGAYLVWPPVRVGEGIAGDDGVRGHCI